MGWTGEALRSSGRCPLPHGLARPSLRNARTRGELRIDEITSRFEQSGFVDPIRNRSRGRLGDAAGGSRRGRAGA